MPVRVVADERERRSGVPEELRSLGAFVEYRVLDVADYVVGQYAIERKSVRDFVNSLYTGRLFDQAHRIGEAYDAIFLLVEGDLWHELARARNPRSLWGALISSVLDFGLNTFFAPDEKQTAQFVYTLAKGGRHMRGPEGPPLIVRKPKTNDVRRVQLSVLSSLPGVGPRMAEKLLDHFGSLRAVFAASATEMSVGAGVGKSRALSLLRLLDAGHKGSKIVQKQVSLGQT
jgi:DNA excision repair protein ERCC-4